MNIKTLSAFIILAAIILASCGGNEKKNEMAPPYAEPEKDVTAPVNSFENLLTASDVEQISGLKGVKFVARNPKIGAGGDLNFSTNGDKLIVMIQVVDESNFEGYKKYYFKSSVSGLGQEAMRGATLAGLPDNQIAFKKGNKCVALTSFMNMENMKSNMLSPEQIIALAKIIDSRI